MAGGKLEDKQVCGFPAFFVLSPLVKVVPRRLCALLQSLALGSDAPIISGYD